MGPSARALGIGAEFQFQGETYTLAPLTYEKLARYSVWLVERARKAVRRAARYTPQSELDRLQNLITRDEAAGHYEPFGRLFFEAQDSSVGQREILTLMLQNGDCEVDELTVLEMRADSVRPVLEDGTEGESKWEEILRKMGEVNSDPKAKRAMTIPMPTATAS